LLPDVHHRPYQHPTNADLSCALTAQLRLPMGFIVSVQSDCELPIAESGARTRLLAATSGIDKFVPLTQRTRWSVRQKVSLSNNAAGTDVPGGYLNIDWAQLRQTLAVHIVRGFHRIRRHFSHRSARKSAPAT
jgi:hypothetical protein